MGLNAWFSRVATKVAHWAGNSAAFVVAVLVVAVWGVTGPLFGFSDTWQLVINTGTTIVTFLMVFLIQNTQNRDIRAVHLKLDELLRAGQGARERRFIDIENRTEDELDEIHDELLVKCGVCVTPQEHDRHRDHPHGRHRPAAERGE